MFDNYLSKNKNRPPVVDVALSYNYALFEHWISLIRELLGRQKKKQKKKKNRWK
jgi:predicted kinase